MSFFIKGKQVNGAKRLQTTDRKAKKRKFNSKASKNEEITSSEEEDAVEDKNGYSTESENENETAQEKKVRLAKLLLEEIGKEEKARLEKEEIDQNVISKRLKTDYLKETGRLRLSVADKFENVDTDNIRTLKCKQQKKSLTCLCITSDDKLLFSASKDGTVIKYSLENYRKVGCIPFVRKNDEGTMIGHTNEIFSLAISSNMKFLAVGDKVGEVHIWCPSALKHIKTFRGHKNSIFGLAFKKESHTLYSCGKDKSVKVWNLDEMAYVETLFGHQDQVTSIDALYKDRVITSGGRDLRVWKITEETQLIYNGHEGNIDNVRLINEENFVSTGDDGQVCIWSVTKKKPAHCIQEPHGKDPLSNLPRWVTAVSALTNTDLIATGSYDGFVRLWKLGPRFQSATQILQISVAGIINAMVFTSDGKKLIISVSREYRLGRWITEKAAKNCIFIVPFVISK